MRAFARLLDCLVYTQSRNRKTALLGHYFRSAPDPDRGWALAALTDGVPIRLPLRRMVGDLTGRFIDPVLYQLSRDYVGDTAETVALLWPDDPVDLTRAEPPTPNPTPRGETHSRYPRRRGARGGVKTLAKNRGSCPWILTPPLPPPRKGKGNMRRRRQSRSLKMRANWD